MNGDGKFRCDGCGQVIRGYNYEATYMGDITCGKCLLAERGVDCCLSPTQLAALRSVLEGKVDDLEGDIELIQSRLIGVEVTP